jgi:hypothetical protein
MRWPVIPPKAAIGSSDWIAVHGFRLWRVTFFAGTKKVTKEMPSWKSRARRWLDGAGIFRLAILARSENGAHPCAPPSGSIHNPSCSIFEAKATAK